ncbi:nuclear transport factor 2 family protein [Spirosoma foliorum]|uniref:Nuclear transport factor 2 family protein n=1 Tax=Spirosoma foliorum TaxID=2710596 RepID=A0A7G5GWZ7_9BACT|nr:nuclear transport factor 2 family protein [Spirosoma foliorum]QMW03389.1 nuclear transport factor 2 family protein [Spirosoma foliorum]QMW03422.1 nuclear transport factor 2 family protein [Spirosoma foliorum]
MKLVFVLIGFVLAIPTFAQSGEEAAVKATVNRLFEGMQKADSTILKPLFTPTARLQTVANKQGDISVRDDAISLFINSIGKATAGTLDERLASIEVKIDAELATAWTPYVFYRNDTKSHCGVNAFTLVKMNGSWKIQTIIDTRRKENCPDLPKK